MGKKYEHSHLVSQAKTGPGRRAVGNRLPKVLETPKNLLALRGQTCSNVVKALLADICMLKTPHCRRLTRKNEILPFEAGGETHLENLTRLNNCSLFAFANHNKKRPHNLILGRTFAHHILDMIEFGVTNYTPLQSFQTLKSAPGSVPLLLFNGDDFETSETTRTIRSLFLDIFRGPTDLGKLNLKGVDRVIVFTLQGEEKILFRQYAIRLVRCADSTLPSVKLAEAGPRFDLTVRRAQLAPETLRQEAMKKPRDPRKVHKVKNITRDDVGDRKGRVHVGKQDLSGLALARMKGLGKRHRNPSHEGPAAKAPRQTEEHTLDESVPTAFPEESEPAPDAPCQTEEDTRHESP